MSIGPTGIVGSAAGSPLSQAKGTDTEKAQQDTANQANKIRNEKSAEMASGVGETEQDEQAQDGEPDGRRLWEKTGDGQQEDDTEGQSDSQAEPVEETPQSKDASGQRGNNIDLTG